MEKNIIPPSIFNAYHVCKRQAWLMSHSIIGDQDNTFIQIGKLIDETSYKREKKRIYIPDISAQIDMIVKKDGKYCIVEIKKSSKKIDSAIMQLKYYLFLLSEKSINVKGILKIPSEKRNIDISLSEEDNLYIKECIVEIRKTIELEFPPEPKKIKVCPKCNHFEFCWS